MVVGVVGDVKMDALKQTRSATSLYVPLGQLSPARDEAWQSYGMSLVVRTNTDPLLVLP